MKNVLSWIHSRTGSDSLIRSLLYEHIPGGARWRYVWGSTLIFCFVTQMITGFFLWMSYSPSSQTAWESVYYIQYVMDGGWFLRGIHHYTAQIMMVLLVLHVMQVIIDGAYRAPREFNFWIGMVLLMIVMGLGLTGYLLPWDQKGYWATKVATNIMGLTPVVGSEVQGLVVGGAEYGHHTLTRFFALHAGLLPFLMLVFIGIHIFLFRRHGIHPKVPAKRADSHFWPDQVLKDGIACLAVLFVVLFLVVYHHGAPLFAPAEPSVKFEAARPDWYFLFLFQFLKYFEGELEVWGALYIPGIVVGLIALMPLVGNWKLGHRFNVVYFFALVVGAALLTAVAMVEDAQNEAYQVAVKQAHRNAERVRQLARRPDGISPDGARQLLLEDALTQGPILFAKHCAACHRYDGHDGLGKISDEKQYAADLKGFASREWLTGFFDPDQFSEPHYFGGTAFVDDGDMVEVVADVATRPDESRAKLVKALSAQARLRRQREVDRLDADEIASGLSLMKKRAGEGGFACRSCHRVGTASDYAGRLGKAPDLIGYGSREWLIAIIKDPEHKRFYRDDNDRMPRYGPRGILNDHAIEMVVDWLRGEWFVPGMETLAELSPAPPAIVEKPELAPPAVDASKEVTRSESKIASGTDEKPTEPVTGNSPPGDAPRVSGSVDFAGQIKPILENSCFKCHGGRKRIKGGYRLNDGNYAFQPGESDEPPIVRGDKSASLLYQLITSDDEDERMPPEDPPLTDEEVRLIGHWIDSGAAWPEGLELEKHN